jgi:hypothetical protein
MVGQTDGTKAGTFAAMMCPQIQHIPVAQTADETRSTCPVALSDDSATARTQAAVYAELALVDERIGLISRDFQRREGSAHCILKQRVRFLAQEADQLGVVEADRPLPQIAHPINFPWRLPDQAG